MTRWQLEQELFEEMAALEPSARSRVLRERAGGDEELVRRVERLVAADARPLAALEGTATDLWLALRDEPAPETLCGTTFGPYRVDAYLASGGMAHVYRATRTSAGTERRVALKVLRPVLGGEDFLARFQRERETLAGLEHEHVVAFLDAGALPDGRPFLVMEYVEGVPLTAWARGVPLGRRLELFLQVLAAVQYAHQKLVLHRDLKPSNVLVTAQGAPKLLDFGVATALEPAGQGVGVPGPLTPGYASPEQLRGENVTTASDVYSLGVLLCELATGGGAEEPERAPAGDLAAIVEKARAPIPRERYRSADELAGDLRRFLAAEPVSARRATWAYRAQLFARRNRWPLALAAAIVVAAVAGWIGSDLRRRSAERDASRGWGAHSEARAAARVFEEWIASTAAADPRLGAAAAAHLESSLRGSLAERPEAETLVRLALAELYLQLGDRAAAALHAEHASRLAHSTPGVGEAERRRAAVLLERSGARTR
ncbi:MAG: serine/threonine protein kinase [Planctomycetes bacterium]|nr:serine/threonine protein kinase [Planctomycetota bacterium]